MAEANTRAASYARAIALAPVRHVAGIHFGRPQGGLHARSGRVPAFRRPRDRYTAGRSAETAGRPPAFAARRGYQATSSNCCGLMAERLATGTADVSGEMLGWLFGKGIEPHIPVIDKSDRRDGTFSNAEFRHDPDRNEYTCLGGKALKKWFRQMNTQRRGWQERPPEVLHSQARLFGLCAQGTGHPEPAYQEDLAPCP